MKGNSTISSNLFKHTFLVSVSARGEGEGELYYVEKGEKQVLYEKLPLENYLSIFVYPLPPFPAFK